MKIDTSYHLLALAPFGKSPEVPMTGGLPLGAVNDEGALIVFVGVRDGRVEVEIAEDPSAEFAGGFEDEATFLLDIQEELILIGWDDVADAFTPTVPGPHHVRVRARGRRDHWDESMITKKAVDFYQLTIWPA